MIWFALLLGAVKLYCLLWTILPTGFTKRDE
jgi:hypothetical protein